MTINDDERKGSMNLQQFANLEVGQVLAVDGDKYVLASTHYEPIIRNGQMVGAEIRVWPAGGGEDVPATLMFDQPTDSDPDDLIGAEDAEIIECDDAHEIFAAAVSGAAAEKAERYGSLDMDMQHSYANGIASFTVSVRGVSSSEAAHLFDLLTEVAHGATIGFLPALGDLA